jgi:hypothetical protein
LIFFSFATLSALSHPEFESWTPMKTRSPDDSCFLTSATFSGIAAMHGPHHVAQKSTTTTLPLLSAMEVCAPIHVSVSSVGAGLPSSAFSAAGRFAPSKNHSSGIAGGAACACAAPAMGTRRMLRVTAARAAKRTIAGSVMVRV